MPDQNLATLVASHVRVERGARRLIDDLSLSVGPGTCLGIVGPNGVGKSTLLEVLAGRRPPDAGRIECIPPSATVGLLTQEAERSTEETGRALLERVTGCAAADAELLAASALLAAGVPGAAGRYAAAWERWSELGVDTFTTRLGALGDELGLDDALLDLPTAALSGGQAARLALAAVLLGRFDVLALDEPTNDLDLAGLETLERTVASRKGATVVVSHDRAFLEATVTAVLEVDEHDGTARLYEGGWAAFIAERATARRHAEDAYARYRTRRADLAARAQREREWASSAVRREKKGPRDADKAQRDFQLNRTERLAQRARRTERAIERLEEVEKPFEGWELRFAIAAAQRAGTSVARLEGAVVERGGFRLGPLDLEITWGERLLITGPNGSGKTTVLRAILGEAPLAAGGRFLGPSVVAGVLAQERRNLEGGTLLAAFQRRTGLEAAPARSLLAKFGLGAAHVPRPTASLSPGERTRAELALFQAMEVNFLVLDEPTNHLDLPAIEQLETALAGYRGTLVLVTHDRRLRDAVATTRALALRA